MCQTMARFGGVTMPRRSRTPGNRGIRRQRLPPGGSLPRSPWASTHRHVSAPDGDMRGGVVWTRHWKPCREQLVSAASRRAVGATVRSPVHHWRP